MQNAECQEILLPLYIEYAHRSSLLTRKLSIVLSLRGPKGRGNLQVSPIEMHSSIDTLYREIAPKGIPFGPTSLRSSQ